jgi:hypothetical protein
VDRAPSTTFAVGFLAALPLFLAYELGLASAGRAARHNVAELLLGRGLEPLGSRVAAVRMALLALAQVLAFLVVRARGVELGRNLLRVFAEGLAAALLLGPLLVLLQALLSVEPIELAPVAAPPTLVPPLERIACLAGAGAWEELLFRAGVFSIVWLGVFRSVALFSSSAGSASRGRGRRTADAIAASISAFAFASAHLTVVTRAFGLGGEPFVGAVFLWRALAGLALGVLFRWRGFGVAAWAHALYNLAQALGASPAVFR